MRISIFSTILLLCCSLNLSAQIVIRGKIANVPTSGLPIALVEYWSVDRWQQLAILQLEAGGAFSASATPTAAGQCRIRMASQAKGWSDFLLPAPGTTGDSIFVFDLDFRTMNGGPAHITGSAENDLYFSLLSAYQSLKQLRDSSAATPKEQLQKAEQDFNRRCTDMSKQHPGTFTGDIVANLLYQPGKEDYPKDPKVATMSANAFAVAHSLEKIPFRYDRVLYHTAFPVALNRYFHYFDASAAEGSKNYIDGIMSRRNGNEAVDVFLFKYLLDKMLEAKDEAGLHHLLTWYLPDCSDESPLPDNTRTLIQALQSCAPGKIIPELQMPGADGADISLDAVCAKNKMTLLYFWRSNCSHCKEFKPVLMELYEKYHPQGLEVLALSLDKTDAGWKQTLEHEPNKWANAFVPTERRLELNRLFPIPSTPTLIALDSKRTVLSRLILREQLETYLKATLPTLGNK